MQLEEAVKKLQLHLELKELKPDDQGRYVIVFDERLEIDIFEPAADQGFIYFKGYITELPEAEYTKEAFLKKCLQANLARVRNNEDYLAVDPDSQGLELYNKTDLENIDALAFFAKFEAFVNNLEFWKDFAQDTSVNETPLTPFIIHP